MLQQFVPWLDQIVIIKQWKSPRVTWGTVSECNVVEGMFARQNILSFFKVKLFQFYHVSVCPVADPELLHLLILRNLLPTVSHPEWRPQAKTEARWAQCDQIILTQIIIVMIQVMTVIASPGQGPDRSTEVSYTDTKVRLSWRPLHWKN